MDRVAATYPRRRLAQCLIVCLVGIGASHATTVPKDQSPALQRTISAPDCVDASRMVAEFDPAPLNVTYLRVQHIGDPGTAELAGEVANPVSWDVGRVTGLSPPSSLHATTQRGFRNAGPPVESSAFQLWCNGAGFWINSRQFSHAAALTLEGPSASVTRDLAPAATVFRNGTSALRIAASIAIPTVRHDTPPIAEGTAQVSLYYYVRDTTSGIAFVHVIALFDNRAAGVNGAGSEAISADAYTAFVVSPLAPTTSEGAATQYLRVAPGSATMHYVTPWSGSREVAVEVPYDRFRAMVQRLRSTSLPGLSPRPEDYRVTSFGVLGEVFPGTGTAHEVALGASVLDLRLEEAYDDVLPVAAVEYYNAALDHYFVSTRADDIEALDSGRLRGWARTGQSFGAYPVFVETNAAVCRFYLPPAYGDSHFLSAAANECIDVAARFPQFVLESGDVMYTGLPDTRTGACPAGRLPVFRLWNQRADTNHRYTTDPTIRQQMLDAGWRPEGYGDSGVAMCAPAR